MENIDKPIYVENWEDLMTGNIPLNEFGENVIDLGDNAIFLVPNNSDLPPWIENKLTDVESFTQDSTLVASFQLAVALLGITTNLINILIYIRQGIAKESATMMLFLLSITDLVFCLTLAWAETLDMVRNNSADARLTNHIISYYAAIPYIMGITREASVSLLAYISFERMVAVTFPFKVKSLFTPKRSCGVSILVLIISTAHKVSAIISDSKESSMSVETTSSINTTNDAISIVGQPSKLNFVTDNMARLISVVLVVVFNTTIIIKIKNSQSFRKGSTTKAGSRSTKIDINSSVSTKRNHQHQAKKGTTNTKELKLIRMLIAISALSVICNTHVIVNRMLGNFGIYDDVWNLEVIEISLIQQVSTFVNYATACLNIFIYFSMSEKYRKELASMASCCRRKGH